MRPLMTMFRMEEIYLEGLLQPQKPSIIFINIKCLIIEK